jgi:phosphoglycerate dehydrogenase-like enzyme
MKPAKQRRPLNIVLWGRVAAHGRRLLQQHLSTPCRFSAFPTPAKDGTIPQELAQADVVVASAFGELPALGSPRLKLLHAPGAGVDGFCLKALGPQTTVANAFFHGPAIGEYVLMSILALSRDLIKMDASFRRGTWYGSWIWGTPPPAEICGKTLGLVGYGHIGKEVATRARAFGMKVWVVSAHPPAKKPGNIEFHEGPGKLRELLKASDYVVLACPLNDQTRGLMGKREFGWMKRTACLINVARGPVVQEEALFEALSKHRIKGTAIDVWYQYPTKDVPFAPSRFPFNELDNIIMTPHVSGWMKGTMENRFHLIAQNINRLAAGEQLVNVVQGPKRHKALS